MYRTYASAVRQPASHSHYKAKSGSAIQDQSAAYAARPIDAAKKASVGMEDVRIHYSVAPPIQRRASLCDVVQLAPHIHELDELDNTDIPVIPSVKPTMVFESMGTSSDAMENVYRESRKYKGNTVCVFGLNKKQGGGGALVKEPDRSEIPHHLVNFSFEWSKPDRMDAEKGYEMPFVEARREIMAQAKRLTLIMCDPDSVTDEQWKEVITPTRDDPDLSWSPVYRWIDGDAKDDSSDKLDKKFLRRFVDGEAYIATGAYEWRHESDDTARRAPNYHAFITLVNQKEASLRGIYMRCMREEVHTHTRAGNAYAYGAFYLPESTFLMNQAAHNRISNDRSEINLDEDQTRESMRLFNASGKTRDKIIYKIIYKRQLHVTKPFKKEFSDDGYAKSLMQFFATDGYSKDRLETALQNLRQSAFGSQWDPKDDAARKEYGAYKKKCIDDLDAFLRADNKFVSIQQEIRLLRRQRRGIQREIRGRRGRHT